MFSNFHNNAFDDDMDDFFSPFGGWPRRRAATHRRRRPRSIFDDFFAPFEEELSEEEKATKMNEKLKKQKKVRNLRKKLEKKKEEEEMAIEEGDLHISEEPKEDESHKNSSEEEWDRFDQEMNGSIIKEVTPRERSTLSETGLSHEKKAEDLRKKSEVAKPVEEVAQKKMAEKKPEKMTEKKPEPPKEKAKNKSTPSTPKKARKTEAKNQKESKRKALPKKRAEKAGKSLSKRNPARRLFSSIQTSSSFTNNNGVLEKKVVSKVTKDGKTSRLKTIESRDPDGSHTKKAFLNGKEVDFDKLALENGHEEFFRRAALEEDKESSRPRNAPHAVKDKDSMGSIETTCTCSGRCGANGAPRRVYREYHPIDDMFAYPRLGYGFRRPARSMLGWSPFSLLN